MARKGVYVRAFPPRGFRLRFLPVSAVTLSVHGARYTYADGIFYQKINDEYEIVEPPLGAVVKELPEDAEEIDFDGVSVYELNNALYEAVEDGYEVIDLLED